MENHKIPQKEFWWTKNQNKKIYNPWKNKSNTKMQWQTEMVLCKLIIIKNQETCFFFPLIPHFPKLSQKPTETKEQNIHKHHTQHSTVPNQNQTYQSCKAGFFMATHNYSPGNQSTPKRRTEQYTNESLWMIIN